MLSTAMPSHPHASQCFRVLVASIVLALSASMLSKDFVSFVRGNPIEEFTGLSFAECGKYSGEDFDRCEAYFADDPSIAGGNHLQPSHAAAIGGSHGGGGIGSWFSGVAHFFTRGGGIHRGDGSQHHNQQ